MKISQISCNFEILYNIGIVLALVFFLIWLGWVLGNIVDKKMTRREKYEFLRGFKKGQMTIIAVPAFLMYFVGSLKEESCDIGKSFFQALEHAIGFVGLKYEMSDITTAMGDPFFREVLFFGFILATANAVIFAASFMAQNMRIRRDEKKVLKSKENKLILVGYNPENLTIYHSDKERVKILMDDTSSMEKDQLTKAKDELFNEEVVFGFKKSLEVELQRIVSNDDDHNHATEMNELAKRVLKLVPEMNEEGEASEDAGEAREDAGEVVAKMKEHAAKAIEALSKERIIVINTGNDERNISLCKAVTHKIHPWLNDTMGLLSDLERAEKKLKTVECAAILQDAYNVLQRTKNKFFGRIKIFVFGDSQYETLYMDVVTEGKGCIHYVNKYVKIATDFIDRYPFTRFMDGRHIDYQNALIKKIDEQNEEKDVNINAILVGFGKSNQQIFLHSVANHQFLTGTPEKPVAKPVHYTIFDKDTSENNKNLNHTYFRYRNEFYEKVKAEDGSGSETYKIKVNPDDYLQLPALPADEKYLHLDINTPDFYQNIKSIIDTNRVGVNFLIIAYGNDFENVDLAKKLADKAQEWECDNLHIFVKSRNWHKDAFFEKDEAGNYKDDKGLNFFGYEKDAVYNIDKILSDEVFEMAQELDLLYELEKMDPKEKIGRTEEELREYIYAKWYQQKDRLQRESSLYACMNLRIKMHLMGMEYSNEVPEGCMQVDEGSFWQSGDMSKTQNECNDIPPITEAGHKETSENQQAEQTPKHRDETVDKARTMAIQEHQRWNAFMILKGFVPATKVQITEEGRMAKCGKKICSKEHCEIYEQCDEKIAFTNGKDYARRRHGNLTTFDGLLQYRDIVFEREDKEYRRIEEIREKKTCAFGSRFADKKPPKKTDVDVIKYDYQLQDGAYALLTKLKYKIYRRKDNQ